VATIDDKVVAMSFESSKFESGVSRTMSVLDKLKQALRFEGATRGLADIDKAAQNTQLSGLGSALDNLESKFGSFRLIALGVLANIASQAVISGAQMVKSLTLQPVIQGFQEYETNLNAIQTILANTQAAGTTLQDVNAALLDLNHYSDKTIYNFAQMARNIGTFTAAGVDLQTSTQAIKGIANLAALSGSNADQASTAMYQLSQAISAGRVQLMDWNSVVNAGMGGTVFQRALAQTAVKMGTLNEGAVKLTGAMKTVSIHGNSFRASLAAAPGKDSWLTSKVLTTTLAHFTGDLTDAQLKAEGFTKAEIKAIQIQAKTAQQAATQVKTLGQLMDTTREAVGSGWSQTWQILFGNFGEAKTLFTGISNAVNGFVNASANARNKILGDWKRLGGRTALINSFKNVFQALGDVLKPIHEAFRDFFPRMTGERLAALTKRFEAFTKTLRPSKTTIDEIKRTFSGLFAVLRIAGMIVGGVFRLFARLFGQISLGQTSFLAITAGIGDFLVNLEESIRKGKDLTNFFDGLAAILSIPVKMVGILATAIGSMFDSFAPQGFTKGMGNVSGVLGTVGTFFHNFLASFANAGNVMQPVFDALSQFAQNIGPALASAFQNINFDVLLGAIRTGLLGGLVLLFKRFLGQGSLIQQLGLGSGGGFLSNITSPFNSLTGSLKAMQTQIQSKAIENIAISVGILAASIVALSLVDPKKLNRALGGIAIAFGELLGAMKILDKVMSSTAFIKMPLVAGALILLAGAITILSASVVILAQLSWEELLRGLTGVSVLLAAVTAASIPLAANAPGMVRAGAGITAIAVGMLILAQAVKQFAGMRWDEMGKGLVGVAAGLAILIGGMRLMPKGMLGSSVGLIAVAYALNLLQGAVQKFSGMQWDKMFKGMVGIGSALLIIAGAMRAMPNLLLTGAGLLLVSVALGKISNVVTSMGNLSMDQIAKGLGTLAGSLTILAVALYAMSGTLAGSIALSIAAAGITVLAGALQTLGSMSWQEIVTSLGALAGAFAVIGVAGALITPAIPGLLGLGAALVLIGGGLALAGVGIGLISAGLSALVVALPTGVGILVAAFKELISALIDDVGILVKGLAEIAKEVAKHAPEFISAFFTILNQVADQIIKFQPKFVEMMQTLIDGGLQLFNDNQDRFIAAGFALLLGLLTGLRDNIGAITGVVVDILAKFLTAIANGAGKLVTAGMNIVVRVVRGIASNVGKVVSAAGDILINFVSGLGSLDAKIIAAGANIVVKVIRGIASSANKIVTAGTDAIISFATGVEKNTVRLVNAAGRLILNFLHALRDAIKLYEPQIIDAALGIGEAIIEGAIQGLANKAGAFYDKISGIASSAIGKMRDVIKPGSPSKVTRVLGQSLMDGLALGVRDRAPTFYNAIDDANQGAAASMRDSLNLVAGVLGEIDSNPTITPVLDLSQVRNQAKELAGLTSGSPVASVSLRNASQIQPVVLDEKSLAAMGGTTIHYEQNNTSPKSLSEVDIYRQTRNQLSLLKSSLALP
jgi:tape measure domain-containing protein